MTTETKAFAYKSSSLLDLTFFRAFLFYDFNPLHAAVFAQATARRVSGLFTYLLNNCLLGSNDRLTSHQQALLWLQLFNHSHPFYISGSNPSILNCLSPYILFYFSNDRLVLKIYRYINTVSPFHCSSQFLPPAGTLRWIKFEWRNWIWISAVKPQINAIWNQAKCWIFTSFTFKCYAMGILLDPACCSANLLHAITGLPKLSNAMRLESFELSVEMFA